MKIVIIGAGAMGCLYGSKLSANENNQVWLLDVWKEHIDTINKNGLLMEEDDKTKRYGRVRGAIDPSEIGSCDLAVVFVKSTLTGEAIKKNKKVFGEKTVALTLQNGMGNVEEIGKIIGTDNVIAGTTAHGATMLGPGKVRHAGNGKTMIGELDGNLSKRIIEIADTLCDAGFETEVSGNVLGLVWDKLLVNVGINALTALTELPNGDLVKIPELESVMEKAIEEGMAVAKAKGIHISSTNPIEHTKEICLATSNNNSSMLQDILNKRVTEIDMINGAIVREGKMVGVDTPVNETLTHLIKWKQSVDK